MTGVRRAVSIEGLRVEVGNATKPLRVKVRIGRKWVEVFGAGAVELMVGFRWEITPDAILSRIRTVRSGRR